MGQRLSKHQGQLLDIKLKGLIQENAQLRNALKRMTDDPQGVIQPFLIQLETAVKQNNKLSALVATQIDRDGGKLAAKVGDLEAFVGKRLTLHFELSGAVEDPATEVVFTYSAEAAKAPVVLTPESVAAEPVETTEALPLVV